MQDRLSRFLGLRQGLVFDSKSTHSGRDVAWLGDCDTGCLLLANKLGWGVKLTYFYSYHSYFLRFHELKLAILGILG